MPAFVIPTTFTAYDRYTPTVLSMSRVTERFAKNANRFGTDTSKLFHRPKNAIDGMLNGMTGGSFNARALAIFGVGGIIATGLNYIVKSAGEAEAATYSFIPTVGSLEKAKSLTQELYKEAQRTSFSFEGLSRPTTLLMSMGAATQKTIIPTLQMLGNLARGDADKLGLISLAYSQIKSSGKMMGQDMNQLSQHIPILPELAKMWGVPILQARKMAHEGRASFDEVVKAMVRMTSFGGAFFQAASLRMNSLPGQVERFNEYLTQTAITIGDQMLPAFKKWTDKMTVVVQGTKEWAIANQDLIGDKTTLWLDRMGNGALWLFNNLELVWGATKLYVGALVTLKAISMVVAAYQYIAAARTFILSGAMGVAAATSGTLTAGIVSNKIALGFYTITTWGANTASVVFGTTLASIASGFLAVAGAVGLATAAYIYHKNNTKEIFNDFANRKILKKSQELLVENYKSLPKEMDAETKYRKAIEKTVGNIRHEEDSLKQVKFNQIAKNDMDGLYKTEAKISALQQSMEQMLIGRNYLQNWEKEQNNAIKKDSIETIRMNAGTQSKPNSDLANQLKLIIENGTDKAIKTQKVSGIDVNIKSTKNYPKSLDR